MVHCEKLRKRSRTKRCTGIVRAPQFSKQSRPAQSRDRRRYAAWRTALNQTQTNNPYFAGTGSQVEYTAASSHRPLQRFLPCLLFPMSFLVAAVLLTQIGRDQPAPIDYLKTLVFDVPVPFVGLSIFYLLLRLTVFSRGLSKWPWLSVLGGIVAFFLMTPIYFAAISPLLQNVDSELVHLLLMLLAGSFAALITELAARVLMARLMKWRRRPSTVTA